LKGDDKRTFTVGADNIFRYRLRVYGDKFFFGDVHDATSCSFGFLMVLVRWATTPCRKENSPYPVLGRTAPFSAANTSSLVYGILIEPNAADSAAKETGSGPKSFAIYGIF
jgi:hypothetical protein